MKQKRFCPNCGSDWVEPDTTNAAEMAFSGGNPNMWHCNECGYTGLMPEGDPDEEGETGNIEFENNEEVSRFDYGFGKAYLKYLLYIALPVTIIYILFRIVS